MITSEGSLVDFIELPWSPHIQTPTHTQARSNRSRTLHTSIINLHRLCNVTYSGSMLYEWPLPSIRVPKHPNNFFLVIGSNQLLRADNQLHNENFYRLLPLPLFSSLSISPFHPSLLESGSSHNVHPHLHLTLQLLPLQKDISI